MTELSRYMRFETNEIRFGNESTKGLANKTEWTQVTAEPPMYNRIAPMKVCNESDFIRLKSESVLDDWTEYDMPGIICPSVDDMGMKGKGSGNDQMVTGIVIRRCKPSEPNCETDPDKIDQALNQLIVNVFVVTKKPDFEKFGQRPVQLDNYKVNMMSLAQGQTHYIEAMLRPTTIETQDSFFPVFTEPTVHDEYLSFQFSTYSSLKNFIDPLSGGQPYIYLAFYQDSLSETHSREIYNILDLLGDFGGLMEVFLLVAQFFVAPWAEHIFNLKAIQKMFLVKSKTRSQFKRSKSDANTKREHRKGQKIDTNNDSPSYFIGKVSLCQELFLFMKSLLCGIGQESKDTVIRWFAIGQEKLETEFDVLKILNTLRKVKLISKQTDHSKREVLTDKRNLIDLDSEEGEGEVVNLLKRSMDVAEEAEYVLANNSLDHLTKTNSNKVVNIIGYTEENNPTRGLTKPRGTVS